MPRLVSPKTFLPSALGLFIVLASTSSIFHTSAFQAPGMQSRFLFSSFRRFSIRSAASKSHYRSFSTFMSSTSTPPEYDVWVRRLYETNMFHPVKMGLANIEALYAALPPTKAPPLVVHIAGTNGKGSVAWKIAQTLRRTGLDVGLFTSPHISSFRERMQLNFEPISEQQVVTLLPHIYDLCNTLQVPATFFEITTALAFLFFHDSKADVIVLETGLGGRLDATNVVRAPALSVITSIGLEHTRILGDTIELIAQEKAGIMKHNCPVLVGPNVPMQVMRECAKEKGVSGFYTSCEQEAKVEGDSTANTALVDYDLENAQIAKVALQLLQREHPDVVSVITDDMMKQGIEQRPPCRFEVIEYKGGQSVVLDVAHNPPAMEYLAQKLATSFPGAAIRVVVGLSADKDLSLCAKSLLQIVNDDVQRIHVVEAGHPRAAKLEEILKVMPDGVQADLEDRSVSRQMDQALGRNRKEIIVVCGSVFLMAEARERLGIDEPRDSTYIAAVAGAGVKYAQENFGKAAS